jgi:hypothetical protein
MKHAPVEISWALWSVISGHLGRFRFEAEQVSRFSTDQLGMKFRWRVSQRLKADNVWPDLSTQAKPYQLTLRLMAESALGQPRVEIFHGQHKPERLCIERLGDSRDTRDRRTS